MSVGDHRANISHQMFRIRHTELNEIFFVMSLRGFVSSMISMFIPLYLYNLGFTLRDILLTNLTMFTVEFCAEYFAAKLRNQFGPKHAIALSMPFLVAHFWLFATIPTYHWPLWFPAICGGLHLALYWQAYHYDFSRSKHKGQATKDVSNIYIILAILGAIAPFTGGWIATNFGFNYLYLIVIAALSVVFLPLLKKGERHEKQPINLSKIRIRDIWRDLLSYGGAGIEATISLVIWPMFVYLIVKTYENVGFVTSIALVLTIVTTYFVGRKVNNKNRHRFIKESSFIDSVLFALFIFVDSFVQVATLNLVQTVAASMRQAPYTSEYYLHADENSRSEYILYMESVIDFVKILVYLILIGATFLLGTREVLVVGLLFGALGAMLAGLMPRSKCELPYCDTDKKIRLIPKLRPVRESR